MISETPRVRFAPSPTGYLHVGGLRTALYNYLFAKKNNGKCILRIEDTDRNRYVEGAAESLVESLKWSGLEFDESPQNPGEYGPYTQSERNEIYDKHVKQLIENGNAYYCFCTPERIKELRDKQYAAKEQPIYDKHCLNLSKEEIEEKLAAGMPHVVRLNVRHGDKIYVDDIVRGRVEFDSNIVDDQVLIKSDGYPTYHLANVVDDHLMKISHVIRGEEWLSSTPKHALLYDYFGWERPQFAHLPLLLNPDKTKLSKRQGDVAVEDYRDKGYLRDALVNFVALLGWSAGDNQEFYKLDGLVEKFSLERVHKAGAVFNIDKLNWLNFEHLRLMPVEDKIEGVRKELDKAGYDNTKFSDEYLSHVIEAMVERVNFIHENVTNCPYFYTAPTSYDEKAVAKRWKEATPEHLDKLLEKYESLENPAKEDYETALKAAAEELGVGNGKLIHPVRLSVSGMSGGPGLYDILVIIGKDETIRRIKEAKVKITALK